MRVGVIGTGTIASAVVTGIAEDGHSITLSERNAERSSQLSEAFENIQVASNQAVIDASDIVFIGTSSIVAQDVLAGLNFRAGQQVISLMAGPSLQDVAIWVAPAHADALMIPFPFIAQGRSPVLVFPQSELVEQLFGKRNTVIALNEYSAMKDYLAAQALLSPITMMLSEASDWLGDRIGSTFLAEQFLRLLIGGSLLSKPLEEPDILKKLIADLNTPGGFNAQLRDFLGSHGTYDALKEGLDLLEARQKED